MGGFYYVNDAQGHIHECRAAGRFRNEDVKPLAGDYVDFSQQKGLEYGYVEQIHPRTNELTRPPVANVDAMLLVAAASQPHIDFMLCDKLLIQTERAGISPIICINKTEANQKTANEIKRQYAAYDVLLVSAYERTGIDALQDVLRGKCVCFTGQSAVGKSSLLNLLDESLKLEVGGLSKKTARGKHTTRVVELLYIPRLDAYLFDTPGFSMFDMGGLDVSGLPAYYREFTAYAPGCRFNTCQHDKEPGCAVKQAVADGGISQERYERYLRLKHTLEEKK